MALKDNHKMILKIVALALVALLSVFWVAEYAASPESHKGTIEIIDQKTGTVMALSAATTAASVVVSAIPGDAATPIASELADLSTMFWIVLAALYLEKYLITIAGYGTFMIIVPAACLLFALYVWQKDEKHKSLGMKLLALGLVLFLAVPSGIKVANVIDQTYESSISTTINEANNAAKEAEKSGNKGLFSGITDAISDSIDYVKNILNNFVEAFAVLLVTSCLIPLAVLAFLIWFIDFVFGININLPKMPKKKALAHKTLALEQATETSEPTQEQ